MEFLGYRRPDGSVGIRNHVLVLPVNWRWVMLATDIVESVRGTETLITTGGGGGRTRRDNDTLRRIYEGLGKNPNTAAVLLLGGKTTSPRYPGFGIPQLDPYDIANTIAATGKPVEVINVLEEGGFFEALRKGVRCAREMAINASRLKREPCGLGDLAIGIKCGYSDATSGAAGNPTIGWIFDRVLEAGGTGFFGEHSEVIGAEHVLAKRAATPEVAEQIIAAVKRREELAISTGEDLRTINPMLFNVAGGIMSVEEKSLGAIKKTGSQQIQGVLRYGERPGGKGLYFMDAWMFMSIFLGFAAAGSNLNIFQIGGAGAQATLKSPMASSHGVVTPLMWSTGNPNTYSMAGAENIDFSSGAVYEGRETVEQAGEKLLKTILEIASGRMTCAETLRHIDPVEPDLEDPFF